jgi:hypothetical protein
MSVLPVIERSCSRSSAGAVTISALIWLVICVVLWTAERRALGDGGRLSGQDRAGSRLGVDGIRRAPEHGGSGGWGG